MRNLKRALSLAVASVMLVGMMVVGTGASYNDVSTEQNQEAIEVLQAVGIMVGDEDGNFNPEAPVSRNEMAVVMSNLMDYRVATYAGTSPFTDVPTWAEPYVAACYTNGITGGIGNNLYGGSYSVTTVEATLMLMKALGYFQFGSDFGDEWQLAVTKQANKIELLDGVDSGVKEAMTRNDLAQLVLNTLKSGIVEADDDTIKVTTDNATVEAGSVNYIYVTSSKSYASAISKTARASDVTGISTSGWIVELGEKLYQGDLKLDDDTVDSFGRPAVTWTYKVDEIGTYADDALAVYTKKATKGDLYALIGSSNVTNLKNGPDVDIEGNVSNDLTVYVDGVLEGNAIPSGISKVDEDAGNIIPTTIPTDVSSYFNRNDTGAAGGISGKGVLTEVYQDDDNNVTIVFVNTYVAQANADYNEDKGDLNISLLTAPVGFSANILEDDEFDVVDFKEDDYILYTVSYMDDVNGEIKAIAPAKVVTGEVNAYAVGDYVKIDGTQYDYAARIEGNKDDGTATEQDPITNKYSKVNTDSADTSYVVTDTASVVLDAYGYVIYVDDASISVGNYVYIDAISAKSGLNSSKIADAYFSDGRNEEITIKSLTKKDGTEETFADLLVEHNTNWNGWYSFTKTSDGKYKLTEAQTSTVTNSATEIENGRVNIGMLGVSGNSDTIFVVDDGDDITVYTGIANVPDITPIAPVTTIPVAYMQSKDNASKAAILVYIDAENAKVKDSTKDSLLYLLKLDSTYVDKADNENIYKFIAVLDGVTTTVETKDSTWEVGQFFESYSLDSDGYYEGDNSDWYASDDNKAIQGLTNVKLSYDKGILTVSEGVGSFVARGDYVTNGEVTGDGNVYITLSDTKLVLIMRPSGSSALTTQLMRDDSAKYEVRTYTSGSSLAGLLKNYDLTGRIFVSYDDDYGINTTGRSELAEVIYLEVTSATYNPNH